MSNAATFFTTFANVKMPDRLDSNATFGMDDKSTWRPFTYAERVRVAKLVEPFKAKVMKKETTAKTKRSAITEFIRSLQSRQ